MTDPAMTNPDTLIAAATAFTSAVSAAAASVAAVGIWRGIGAMVSTNKDRSAQAAADRKDAAADRAARAEADERRHTETMRALDMQRRALETLIERTAPPAR